MKIFLIFLISIFISFASFANRGMHGGNPHGGWKNSNTVTGTMPPGLHKKGMPHGLQMQNKTPSGWSQGNKEGWNKQQWIKQHKKTFKQHQLEQNERNLIRSFENN